MMEFLLSDRIKSELRTLNDLDYGGSEEAMQ